MSSLEKSIPDGIGESLGNPDVVKAIVWRLVPPGEPGYRLEGFLAARGLEPADPSKFFLEDCGDQMALLNWRDLPLGSYVAFVEHPRQLCCLYLLEIVNPAGVSQLKLGLWESKSFEIESNTRSICEYLKLMTPWDSKNLVVSFADTEIELHAGRLLTRGAVRFRVPQLRAGIVIGMQEPNPGGEMRLAFFSEDYLAKAERRVRIEAPEVAVSISRGSSFDWGLRELAVEGKDGLAFVKIHDLPDSPLLDVFVSVAPRLEERLWARYGCYWMPCILGNGSTDYSIDKEPLHVGLTREVKCTLELAVPDGYEFKMDAGVLLSVGHPDWPGKQTAYAIMPDDLDLHISARGVVQFQFSLPAQLLRLKLTVWLLEASSAARQLKAVYYSVPRVIDSSKPTVYLHLGDSY